jgi:hypothetical protein
MSSINHRRSRRQQNYVNRIACTDPTILTFCDRLAWALLCLIEACEDGVEPLDWPAPRSQYISMLRRQGLVIETVLERHDGPYAGLRGHYILRSPVKIVDRKDAA